MRTSRAEQARKYLLFVEELHELLKVTNFVKINNMTKLHKVSTALPLALEQLGVIKKERRSHYKWTGGVPSLLMVNQAINKMRGEDEKAPDQLEISPVERKIKEIKKDMKKPVKDQPLPIKEAPSKSRFKMSLMWGLFTLEK